MNSTDSTHPPVRRMSPRAAATRSLRLAERLTGEARREALAAHAAMVFPARSCPVRKF
ncbi:hypothetical protein SAMN05443665_100158 [Actinomadura meyerae]|uniref:Uncharacterized protein n=1 Tax=Actinomadura meyerae TaxID=240840 RepID=A0A239BTZ2_9ACTN|nr:hypothetical protein [Actinomadura meyerae]SNS11515.1 hypothetical protein SAMN05443665_100158 [Actinomadura meyerae]